MKEISMIRLIFAGLVLAFSTFFFWTTPGKAALMDVNYAALVSRADLTYSKPAGRSEEGIPVGNGRMGSLVWTTPTALRFQINRVDVFAEDSSTTSFPRADSDYASGCGYVDIDLVDFGEDVFAGSDFNQHLSVYEGLMTAKGKDMTARVLTWPHHDVMAVEIEDQRKQPTAINIDLRMLRYQMQGISRMNWELTKNHAVMVQTAEHSATSKLDIREGRILLIQQFREKAFYDASAVAISIVGRPSRARYLNEATVQLSAAPDKGRFAVLISSAASFDPNQDVGVLALRELEAAEAEGFKTMQAETAAWWHDFWARGFVYMHSPDGQADFVEQNYTYFLYLMGASSRGKYPPRFGGMLWYTNGDMRRWGSQYWWANTSAYYSNLMPANRLELMDPMFSMFSGMADSCAMAARQQWGSKGIWIPEITFFNGLDNLPDDIAAELQDLYLVRKPYEERSARFQWFAETKNRHNSRWNFQADGKWDHGHLVVPTKGQGIFGHCTHILGAGTRIANLYWQRYQYTMDKDWLRDRAYPMIKGSAEFYRNFPNLKKGDDGKYHIHHVNNGEGSWNSSDTSYEVSCMHTIFPLAIRASEILGVDAEMRPLWQEIKANLVVIPGGGRRGGGGGGGAYGAFVYGGEGGIEPIGPEPELKRRFLGFNRLASFIDSAGIGGAQIFRNRLRLREGPGAIDAEHIGGLTSGIHSTMLSSTPELQEGEPVLKVLNDWPRDWDAAFALLARGAFVVSSAQQAGKIPWVEIRSQAGNPCRLTNPWKDTDVTLYRDGKKAEDLSGETLMFPTKKGETIVVVPKGSMPSVMKIL
jgi:hypothetical protein